jgi:hypothetical protein
MKIRRLALGDRNLARLGRPRSSGVSLPARLARLARPLMCYSEQLGFQVRSPRPACPSRVPADSTTRGSPPARLARLAVLRPKKRGWLSAIVISPDSTERTRRCLSAIAISPGSLDHYLTFGCRGGVKFARLARLARLAPQVGRSSSRCPPFSPLVLPVLPFFPKSHCEGPHSMSDGSAKRARARAAADSRSATGCHCRFTPGCFTLRTRRRILRPLSPAETGLMHSAGLLSC